MSLQSSADGAPRSDVQEFAEIDVKRGSLGAAIVTRMRLPYETRARKVDQKIPKLGSDSNFPDFPEPLRTAEKALTAMMQEAHIPGISTRSVDELVKAMGVTGFSKSQVFRLREGIDERAHAFLGRPIEGD